MTTYKSTSGKQSGVTAYEIGSDYIIVWFYSKQYKYTYQITTQEQRSKFVKIYNSLNSVLNVTS